MLSGETAAGKFPIESVEMMASIIQWSEKDLNKWSKFDYFATLSQQKTLYQLHGQQKNWHPIAM